MTATRPEKDIKHIKDRELINYIYSHIDRSQYEIAGAMKNVYYAKYAKSDQELQEKLIAAEGYGINQIEHLTNLRFAIKELHLRLLRSKRVNQHMIINFGKKYDAKPEQPEVSLPDLWNIDDNE